MKVNFNKPTGSSNPGAAAAKGEVVIFEFLPGFIFPSSDAGGVLIEGSFVLPSGDNMVRMYNTKSKASASMETEGDEDMMSFKAAFKTSIPGNSLELKEFVQFWTGKDVGILHRSCGETDWEVMGTPCAPLQLKATKKDDNDGRAYEVSFEPFAKSGFVPKVYRGALVFAEPFAVVTVTEVPLLIANGQQYKLPALGTTAAVAVDGLDLTHGTIVTFIGGGGAAPATIANGTAGDVTILLSAGTTWTGLLNAVIHFRVFNAGATKYLVELSRG